MSTNPNINNSQQLDVVEKFKIIRGYFDKIYLVGILSFWLISTLWDIFKLQRFWLDYCIEIYSTSIMISMTIYALFPDRLPLFIYNNLGSVTTITGKGINLLLISMLFLFDKHRFHKVMAIFLLIGALLYFACEILVPTTREELNNIKKAFESRKNKNINNNKGKGDDNKFTLTEEKDNNIRVENSKSNILAQDGKLSLGNGEKMNENGGVIDNNNEEKIDKSFEGNEEGNNNKGDKGVGNLGEGELPTLNSIVNPNTKANNNENNSTNPYDIPDDF